MLFNNICIIIYWFIFITVLNSHTEPVKYPRKINL